jgi:hypothetical protein
MIDLIDVIDEKTYLLSELNQNRIDHDRWKDFIAFAERVGCPAMANDMRRRYQNYTGTPVEVDSQSPVTAERE